jgi:hypothetical protein
MGIALVFGLVMMVVIAIVSYVASRPSGIACTVIAGVMFSGLWAFGWKQHREARSDLPAALRNTGVFNEYELDFYRSKMFSLSVRFELGLLLGLNIALALVVWLILVSG